MDELRVVGKSVPRIDALAKVTGKARFCTDFTVPGIIHAKILRSTHPHARILDIDTSRAEGLPGVRAVVTGKDVRPVRLGSTFYDQYLLPCDNIARAVGQPIAAVAADTVQIAEEALELIDVRYEELPAVFDVMEAMKQDPPVVIHPDLAQYEFPRRWYRPHPDPTRPNVFYNFKIRNGDAEKGFGQADLVVENTYRTARIAHAQLETTRGIAWWEADGSLAMRIATQSVMGDASMAARYFGMPQAKVRIFAPYNGGGFGGKLQPLEPLICAVLSLKAGRPVSLEYTREEQLVDGRHRSPFVVHIKDGVRKDGTLVARELRIIIDAGHHARGIAITTKNCAFGAVGTYRLPNLKLDTFGVYTNNPLTGAYRGLGTSELTWAIEQQMDILAQRLGMDPWELRRKNILNEGERDACGQVTRSTGARQCLDRVAEEVGKWPAHAHTDSPWRRGTGCALGNKYTMAGQYSMALAKVYPDGTIEVRHAVDDMGQGFHTVAAQIAAEEFGTSVDRVKVSFGDSTLGAFELLTVSSRSTYSAGSAVQRACRDAKKQICAIASGILGVNPAACLIRDGKVFITNLPGKSIEFSALFSPEGVALQGGDIVGRDYFFSPIIYENPDTGQSERMVSYYAHGAYGVEIAVNEQTGEMKVLNIVGCFDMGQPVNPKMCEGQIEGGCVQGIGSTLYEELLMSEGTVANASFGDYKIPTTLDAPLNMKALIAPTPLSEGPYGAKGLGEATMIPVAPAIGNALFHALGIRVMNLPITKEKVLKALRLEFNTC